MIRVKVYSWNPNGTNDIEIVDTNKMIVLDTIPEALFGYNVPGLTSIITVKIALRYIAISPVNDGSLVAEKLKGRI